MLKSLGCGVVFIILASAHTLSASDIVVESPQSGNQSHLNLYYVSQGGVIGFFLGTVLCMMPFFDVAQIMRDDAELRLHNLGDDPFWAGIITHCYLTLVCTCPTVLCTFFSGFGVFVVISIFSR